MTASVYSQTRDGALLYEWQGVADLRYSDVLNRPGACTFRLPNVALPSGATLDTVLNPGVHEIGVRRGGRTVWLGPLLTVDEAPVDSPASVSFGAEGLMSYTKRWHVEAPVEGASTVAVEGPDGDTVPPGHLEQVDQTEILARLIDHHQGKPGGEVFALDTSTLAATGVLRDRTYNPEELPVIYDSWVQLADVEGGFDHRVDPETRQVIAYYPRRGQRRDDIALTDRNVRSLRRQIDATEQGSQTIGVGSGEGADQLRTSMVWARPREAYGLTQRVYTDTSIKLAATLRERVRTEHLRHRFPPTSVEATVDLALVDRFDLGDTIRVQYTSGYTGPEAHRVEPGTGIEPRAVSYRRVMGIEYDPAGGLATLTLGNPWADTSP